MVQLLWVIFAFVALAATMLVLYKPPRTILHFKHRESELHIGGEGALPTRMSTAEADSASSTVAPPEASAPEAAEQSVFAEAFKLLTSGGDYQRGIQLLEEEGRRDNISTSEMAVYLALGRHLAAVAGVEQALADLEGEAVRHANNSGVKYWLGATYRKLGYESKAREEFEAALRVSSADDQLISAAEAMINSPSTSAEKAQAIEFLGGLESRVSTQPGRARLYASIAKLLLDQDSEAAFAHYEAALAAAPPNNELRFEVAYAYAERGAHAQALHHYEVLLERDPKHHSAANNAGVAAGELQMPIIQMSHYRAAEHLGETLAMANIASRYLHIGMRDEARALLQSAMNGDAPHRNVLHALGALADQESKEDQQHKEVREAAAWVAAFRQRLASAIREHAPSEAFLGTYRTPDGTQLLVDLDGNGALHGALSNTVPEFEFAPTIKGRAMFFSWATKQPDNPYSLLALSRRGTGILCLEGEHLRGYTIEGDAPLDPAAGAAVVKFDFTRNAGH